MSDDFSYNEINFDQLESVELIEGEISPSGLDREFTGELTKEQKRKAQLVDLLEDHFDRFHSFLDELIACYYGYGRRREFVVDTLGIPDYASCQNCSNLAESPDGNPICKASSVEEDGETLYKIIPDPQSIPSFCDQETRYLKFPEERINEVDGDLLAIVEEGYEEKAEEERERYEERREEKLEQGKTESAYVTKDIDDLVTSRGEYLAWEVDKLVGTLIDPPDFDSFRTSALEVAWKLHLDDVLNEEYYPQRAEAYLRAMDSPHQSNSLPGQGGDEFEEAVREYLTALGFPMYDRVFKLQGTRVGEKEMDIHTEFPWGDRAIFEVFTTGAHSEKDEQLRQYAHLLEIAEGVEAVEILLTDGFLSHAMVECDLLFQLLECDFELPDDLQVPGEHRQVEAYPDVQYLGDADTLTYSDYKPDYEPVQASQEAEAALLDEFRRLGFDPSLPVYRAKTSYGFCGPTIDIGDDEKSLVLTFYSNRESSWREFEKEDIRTERNPRMVEKGDHGYGFEWQMDDPPSWSRNLGKAIEKPVVAVEVVEQGQSRVSPYLFDGLVRE